MRFSKSPRKSFVVLFIILICFIFIGCQGAPTGRLEEAPDGAVTREMKAAPMTGAMMNMAQATAHDSDIIPPDFNTEEYDLIRENTFKDTTQNPVSTFSIDVDTASYSNVRRFLEQNTLPPKDAVRIEELINYFDYTYPDADGKDPFSITLEEGPCPWAREHRLVLIGLQGKKLDYKKLPPSNLVFLIDSSGSMNSRDKLPLLKSAFKLLLDAMDKRDRIAIVAYAGSAGLVLPSTPAAEKDTILKALDRLEAGGATAGGEGIELAYAVAEKNLIAGGNNRIILATDGDFNIGQSSTSELVRMIEEKRKGGIFLTTLGFGMGNYKDGRMEQISNAGNGNYFYIDNIREAEKVLVREMRANMFTIAKDVKIQVEFNPVHAAAWRLVGYENRVMAREDFDDDKKDAGELGAGHQVTALYEIIPPGVKSDTTIGAPLKYQTSQPVSGKYAGELMTARLRYKPLDEDKSRLLERVVTSDSKRTLDKTSENFRFAASVAGFGMLLRDSEFKGTLTYADVLDLAQKSTSSDEFGDRAEFLRLVKSAGLLERK
jgi:Ca-activated chloride channel family protein